MNTLTNTVINNVFGVLKRDGFNRKGNKVFTVMNDVLVMFLFEMPSRLLYIHFIIVPVFLPWHGHIEMRFGNRLNSIYKDINLISIDASPEEVSEFCNSVLRRIQENIIPGLEGMATVVPICQLVEHNAGSEQLFFVKPDDLLYLKVYSALNNCDYNTCRKTAVHYCNMIDECNWYTTTSKKEKTKEIEEIIRHIEKEEYDFLNVQIKKNKEYYYKTFE